MATDIPFIEASGTNYEVGLKLGEFSKAILPRFIDAPKVAADAEKIRKDPRTLSASLKAAADRYPKYMDELRGIADGAGRSFHDLFIFNWRPRPRRSDPPASIGPSPPTFGLQPEGCTTLIAPTADGVLLAHNEDWYTGANDVFLARLHYESGFDGIAVCYHGFLPGLSASLNQFGLVQALNNVIASDCGAGVPLALIDRAAMDASSIDEALKIVTQPGRADSENFNFAQGLRAVIAETSGKDFVITEVTQPMAHTNHFVTDKLRPLEASERLDSTHHRLARANQMLAALASPTADDLKAILSSHEDAPWCICRHQSRQQTATGAEIENPKSKIQHPVDYGVTLATAIIDTAARTFDVAIGNPCTATFHRLVL
jgi:hypothetical protein